MTRRRRRLCVGDVVSKAIHEMDTTNWRNVLMSEPCVYCGAVATGLDHIVARSVGGVDALHINRAPACRSCDSRKANTPMVVFLASRRGLRIMPRQSTAEEKRLRQRAAIESRKQMRREYKDANELAFKSGTFGQQLMSALQANTYGNDHDDGE